MAHHCPTNLKWWLQMGSTAAPAVVGRALAANFGRAQETFHVWFRCHAGSATGASLTAPGAGALPKSIPHAALRLPKPPSNGHPATGERTPLACIYRRHADKTFRHTNGLTQIRARRPNRHAGRVCSPNQSALRLAGGKWWPGSWWPTAKTSTPQGAGEWRGNES